jgi:hypothetical protein
LDRLPVQFVQEGQHVLVPLPALLGGFCGVGSLGYKVIEPGKLAMVGNG